MTIAQSTAQAPSHGVKARRHALLACGAAMALAAVWLHWRYGQGWSHRSAHAWGSDDAYITYRYAVNLLQGWGPVFNPGEAVEGYSNPLYLIVVTALMAAVGPEQVYAASVALNALAFAATLPMLGRLAGRVAPDKPMLQAIAPLFGALFPPLWNAAASGLETMPVYALQLGLLTLVLAPPARRGVALAAGVAAALVAIRTDGFVIPLAIAVPLFLAGQRRLALAIVAACAATFAALTAWRLAYYGLPLPNVVYAKVHGDLLSRIFIAAWNVAFFLTFTGILPFMALPFAALPRMARQAIAGGLSELAHPRVMVVGVSAALVGYWFAIGGDAYGERFLLLLYPLGVLMLAWLVADARIAVTLIVLFDLFPLFYDGRFAYADKSYDMWIETGRFLGERHPGATLAVDAAGKIPYFSGLRTIDMLGLNDRHIASIEGVAYRRPGHSKTDHDYVLARQPDLIAAWRTRDYDITWKLDRERYLAAGYCPRYLVYSERDRVPEPIIDLATRPAEAWADISMSWNYMVLERRAECPLR